MPTTDFTSPACCTRTFTTASSRSTGSYFGDGYGIGGFGGFDDNASDDPAFNTPLDGNVTNPYNNPYGGADEPNQTGNNPNQAAPAGDDGSLPAQPAFLRWTAESAEHAGTCINRDWS